MDSQNDDHQTEIKFKEQAPDNGMEVPDRRQEVTGKMGVSSPRVEASRWFRP